MCEVKEFKGVEEVQTLPSSYRLGALVFHKIIKKWMTQLVKEALTNICKHAHTVWDFHPVLVEVNLVYAETLWSHKTCSEHHLQLNLCFR